MAITTCAFGPIVSFFDVCSERVIVVWRKGEALVMDTWRCWCDFFPSFTAHLLVHSHGPLTVLRCWVYQLYLTEARTLIQLVVRSSTLSCCRVAHYAVEGVTHAAEVQL